MDGIRVHEGDLEPEQPAPRHPVNELRAGRLQLLQRRAEISRLERDVMHARPATGEEATDGRVVVRRSHELDAAFADEHRRRLDPLRLERLSAFESRVKETLVRGDRLVEVVHGQAEVVDPPHPGDATAAR